MKNHTTRKRIIIITLQFVLTIFLSFTFLEVCLRIYGKHNNIDYRLYAKELKNSNRIPRELYLWSGDGSYSLSPNANVMATTSDFSVNYSINSKGFRDKDYSYDKPEGITRISIFGDSFTFGEGIPYGERFSDILENNTKSSEVLDFGVPGAGLDDIAANILNVGLKFNSNYIVVALNNLSIERIEPNISSILEFSATDSSKVKGASSAIPDTDNLKRSDEFFNYKPNFILSHSYLASYIYYKYSVLMLKSSMEKYDKNFWQEFINSEKATKQNIDEGLMKSKALLILNKLSTVCIKPKCNLVVVNIDTEPIFDGTEDLQFEYFDLSSELTKEKTTHSLTFKYDQHYNPQTNIFLGQKFVEIFKGVLNNSN